MELKDWIIAGISLIALFVSTSTFLLNRKKFRWDNRQKVLDELQDSASTYEVLNADLDGRKQIFLEFLPGIADESDRDDIVEAVRDIDEQMEFCRDRSKEIVGEMNNASSFDKLCKKNREFSVN